MNQDPPSVAYRVEQNPGPTEPFSGYNYKIFHGSRWVADYWHDYRGEEHRLTVGNSPAVSCPVGRLSDFMEGKPYRLTAAAVAYLDGQLHPKGQGFVTEWSDYLRARKAGLKKVWQPELEKQLRYFSGLARAEREGYLQRLCVAHFDEGEQLIPIQHPVLWDALLEVWAPEIAARNHRYLVWAYQAYGGRGVADLVGNQPQLLLEEVIAADPCHLKARQLLMRYHLDLLDFALHELPFGLVIEEAVCLRSINRCAELIAEQASLAGCVTRFGKNFSYYKKLFFAWQEYQKSAIGEDFFSWFSNHLQGGR